EPKISDAGRSYLVPGDCSTSTAGAEGVPADPGQGGVEATAPIPWSRRHRTAGIAIASCIPVVHFFLANAARPGYGPCWQESLLPAQCPQPETAIMSTPVDVRMARRVLRHELEAIRGNWGWTLALGIILSVVGTIAVAMPLVSPLASAFAFGVLLVVGG